MAGSMRTFGTDCLTDGQTDGADYIGPAVQRPAGRVQKALQRYERLPPPKTHTI